MKPTTEEIQREIALAMNLGWKYGTNQPTKTYEDGVAEALLWALGFGKSPNEVEQ